MMPRVGGGGRVASAGTLLCLLLAAGLTAGRVETAGAAVFDNHPVIGDRTVQLSWQPDPDDPVYNGNTVLRVENRFISVHGSGRAVRQLVINSEATTGYSIAQGENAIRVWRTADGVVTGDLPFPDAGAPVALSMHGSGRRLLGALPDGSFALWHVGRTGPPEVFAGSQRPARALLFYPGVSDTASLPFVSIGADDTLRVWAAPGVPLGPGYSVAVPGGATAALDISSDRSWVAVGTSTGEVRIYDIRTPPNTPFLRLTGHTSPITGVAFTRNRSKLSSADDSGQVRIWSLPDGAPLGSVVETGEAKPFIAFAPPRGRILFVVTPAGRLELHDGDNGFLYRAESVLPAAVHATVATLTSDGIRVFVGDDDGGISVIRAGSCLPSLENPSCFGGYMVWRSPTTDVRDRQLLRIYDFADSTWTFAAGERVFVDPDSIIVRPNPNIPGQPPDELPAEFAGPHNGIPYYYSVTRFDSRYLDGVISQVFPDSGDAVFNGFYRDVPGGPPTALMSEAPARTETPLLGAVFVVPNPYEIGKVPWEESGRPHIEFRNLPEVATIRVYTLAGDLVRRIEHGPGRYGESRDAAEWDFMNFSGKRVASGVYIYQVQTPSRRAPAGGQLPGEVIQGYFTVVL